MSTDMIRQERDEHITQAEIHHMLTQIRDELYLVRRTLDIILVQMAEQRQQVVPVAVPVDYNKRAG